MILHIRFGQRWESKKSRRVVKIQCVSYAYFSQERKSVIYYYEDEKILPPRLHMLDGKSFIRKFDLIEDDICTAGIRKDR